MGGPVSLLFMGSGIFAYGIAAFLGVLMFSFFGVNSYVTVNNIGVALSAGLIFIGAALTTFAPTSHMGSKHSEYTVTAMLAGILIFTGAGSYAAGKWSRDLERTLRLVLLWVIAVVLVMTVITPLVFRACLGFSIFWRITIALLLIAPVGFVLGMPFPLGLRLAMRQSSALGSWAWGVNGFSTVIGTVLALMLGMMIGFRMVLLLASGCYLVGLLALLWLSSSRPENTVDRLDSVPAPVQ